MAQPQHQPHSYHLAMSLILLLLTVYPYLFNNSNSLGYQVAAYSADDLFLRHSSISQFDIIESDQIILSKPISTRSLKLDQQLLHAEHNNDQSASGDNELHAINLHQQPEAIRRVQFYSLGRQFNLVLEQPAHLITDDFTITTLDANNTATKVPFNRNELLVLEGSLAGEAGSRAVASFSKQDRLMMAQISTGSDTMIVEPTYLHKDHLQTSSSLTDGALPQPGATGNETDRANFIKFSDSKILDKTMIVYRLRDHKQFQAGANSSSVDPSNFFGKLCGAVRVNESSQSASTGADGDILARDIEDVFKVYRQKSKLLSQRNRRGIEFFTEQSRDKTRCTLHLVADYLFYKHVGNGDLQTTINYLLALINRVNQIYLPTVWETGDDKLDTFNNIGFTVQNITIHQEFTRLSSSDTHYNMESSRVWGAREFLDNFSRNSPPRHYCLAHLLTYRQFDSPVLGLAYVASTRFGTIGGICSPTQQKGDAFYRHNTGISTAKGINGETLITRQADLVLAHELGHNLGAEHDSNECRPAPSNGGAYLMHPYAVMGFEKNNRFMSNCSRLAIGRVIRRKASSCFVAAVENVCGNGVVEDDEECDGGDVGHGHSDPCCDSSCRFAPFAQCSDRHSWCCNKCRIVPAGRPCRPAEEFNCKQAAYCDGRSADCPRPAPVEDEKVCVGRGLCRRGECVPFCEARELHSCLCNTPKNACKLCCKSSINSTCVPYDDKAPDLQDGVLCYRGVCEKGRCEQPIQDVVERLWDVIEDINFTTLVKFLRDNIILVVLVASIPIWCLLAHFINEFDRRIKQDVINEMIKNRHRKEPPARSPFLPRLFVGDEHGSSNSLDEPNPRHESLEPLKQMHPDVGRYGAPSSINGNRFFPPPPHRAGLGFQPPNPGFQLPPGEEVAIEPGDSIAMNSIELPEQDPGTVGSKDNSSELGGYVDSNNPHELNDMDAQNLYSTQV